MRRAFGLRSLLTLRPPVQLIPRCAVSSLWISQRIRQVVASVPELFAMPVNRRMRFHLNVTLDLRLTCEANFFVGIAQDLEPQQRIQPFPEPFQDPLLRHIVFAICDHDIAAAASPKPHAVNNPVRAGIKLYAILSSDRSKVLAFFCVDRNFFVDKLDLWHRSGLTSSDSGKSSPD